MEYIRATAYLPLILRSGGGGIKIYIDGAHAVHHGMGGHAGTCTTAGKGTLFASSTKDKLNTTSPTESEIVSVGEELPKQVWPRDSRVAQDGGSV